MAGPPADTTRSGQGEGPRRADAVRNREKVLAAAEQVFAAHGIEAGIPEIAERAGVGKGTVYRNFESKDDLVAAILTRRVERLEADIVTALAGDDPGRALREVLRAAAARANDLSFPASIYWAGKATELQGAKARARGQMEKLVREAKKDGAIRKDATVEEIWVQFSGICRILGDAGEKDPKVWRRHADLVADAFRP